MEKFIITEEECGIRIDKFLAEKIKEPRNQIQNLLLEEKILLNENPTKNKYILKVGDEINIISKEQKQIELKAQNIKINIVYEDDDLLVIDKESGMVVHPAPGNPDGTLVNALLYYSENLSDINGEFRPGIVHRIDKDTSGLLIVAKTNDAHNKLAQMIKDREISREYKALVHGEMVEQNAIIKAPVGRDPLNRKRMKVTEKNSKYAETNVTVLDRNAEYTFVKCKLLTGRTHQIRVHLKYINHPLVGDPTYGPRKTLDVKGQALHAYKLKFIHPNTNQQLSFTSKLPKYFQEVLNDLNLKDKSE